MNENINLYNIQLLKKENLIHIYTLNEYSYMVEYNLAAFNKNNNKYCLFKSPTGFVAKVLLHNDLIEQINQESPPGFVLTQTALISLL